jgi:hypothetical protein
MGLSSPASLPSPSPLTIDAQIWFLEFGISVAAGATEQLADSQKKGRKKLFSTHKIGSLRLSLACILGIGM